MSIAIALLVWAGIVIISMAAIAYLAERWGRDPFGWALLAAVLGPIAVIGLYGTHQSDVEHPEPFEMAGGDVAAVRPARRTVLACDASPAAARIASEIARRRPGDEEVLLLTVLPHEARPAPDEGASEDHDRAVEAATAEPLRILRDAGMHARVMVGYGNPAEEILRCADEQHADVIIVGRRGAGLTKALLGSVSDEVVKRARQQVVVMSGE